MIIIIFISVLVMSMMTIVIIMTIIMMLSMIMIVIICTIIVVVVFVMIIIWFMGYQVAFVRLVVSTELRPASHKGKQPNKAVRLPFPVP